MLMITRLRDNVVISFFFLSRIDPTDKIPRLANLESLIDTTMVRLPD